MSVDVLLEKIRKKKCPLALTLNVSPDDIPPDFPADDASPAAAYVTSVLDAAAELVPAVSFDPGWYAALGPQGLRILHDLIAEAKRRGLYVLVKTLRSDGEEGAALSASTWFGTFEADGLCVSAYTGSDGVKPYLPWCRERGKSLFLLARTENRSAREVQDLISGDRVVHTVMLDFATRWGGRLIGPCGYSQVGAVAAGPELRQLRKLYDRTFFLVPPVAAKEAQYAFDEFGHGALWETPRALLSAWKNAKTGEQPLLEKLNELMIDLRTYVQVM